MSEELAKRRRLRAGHRGVANRRLAEARDLVDAEGTPDRMALARFAFSLQEKIEILRQLDGDILNLLDDEAEIMADIEEADKFNQELFETLLKLKEISPSGTTPRASKEGGAGVGRNTRLPELSLRGFDGDITQWISFWDTYEAAVHSNTNLSEVQKFTYLKSLVDRSAKESISGLSLSADNYKEAIAILQKRFGNKQRFIAKHMDILLNIEQITSPNNVLGLRRLYDKVESNVRALGALRVAQESYGTMLSSVLVKKLPQEIRLMVSRKVTDDSDMKAIMDVLGDELEARERAVTTKEGVVDHDKSSRDKKRSSATTLFTNSSKNQASDSCCYCRNEHPSSSCTVVTSREERTKILCTSGRCFNCLRRGHRERDCRSRTRCRACNGRHHSSICQVRSGPVENKKLPQVDHKSPSNTQLNPGAPSFAAAQSKSTSCCLAEGHETVLLQTARASLYNPEGPGNTVEVSLIFDSGSQQSYISRDTSKQLGLRIHGKKILSIATFGTNSELQQPCDMVRVGIMTAEGGTKEISLLSVPVICQPLASLPAHTCLHKYEGLKHLNLADAASERKSPIQPAILIGLDHYWQFMTGETIHCGETGPVASRTVLGWVVSGPVPTDMGSAYGNTYLSTHTLKVTASSGREHSTTGTTVEDLLGPRVPGSL